MLTKEGAIKKAPDCAVRLRRIPEVYAPYFGVLLAVDGTLKTHHLRRFRQVQRFIPSTVVGKYNTADD